MTGIPDECCKVEKRNFTVKETINEVAKFQELLEKQSVIDYKTSQLMAVVIKLLKEQKKEIERLKKASKYLENVNKDHLNFLFERGVD